MKTTVENRELEFNNPHIKNWFLNNVKQELSKKTYSTYEKLLYKVSNFETKIKNGKDLCHFNKNEILDMISYFRVKEATANVIISMARRYFDFCMSDETGFLTSGINFAAEIKSDDLRKVINTRAHSEAEELTYESVVEFAQQLCNARDKAIVMGDFNLIRGLKFEDLINLKEENIIWEENKIIIPKEDGTMRIIEDIDDYTMMVFKMALKQEIYYEDNNDIEIGLKRLEEDHKKDRRLSTTEENFEIQKRTLIQNNYVIRPVFKSNMKKEDKDFSEVTIPKSDIYKTFKDFKFWTDKDWITSKDIYKAGFVHKMRKYFEKIGKESITLNDVIDFGKENDLDAENPWKIYRLYKDQLELLDSVAMDKEIEEETEK